MVPVPKADNAIGAELRYCVVAHMLDGSLVGIMVTIITVAASDTIKTTSVLPKLECDREMGETWTAQS